MDSNQPQQPDGVPSPASHGSAFYPLPGDIYRGPHGAEIEVIAVHEDQVVIETKGRGMSSLPVREFLERAALSMASGALRLDRPNAALSNGGPGQ